MVREAGAAASAGATDVLRLSASLQAINISTAAYFDLYAKFQVDGVDVPLGTYGFTLTPATPSGYAGTTASSTTRGRGR